MEEFENLQGFLEHISLVMDTDKGEGAEAVSIMTLHSAKGLEFDTVFLPGWEEGLLPHQRSLDDQGRAGLEEERRLAHVGHHARAAPREDLLRLEPAHPRLAGRRAIPSRFLDELPEAHVEVTEAKGGFGNFGQNYGALALRPDGELRLELHDARLAARAGAQNAWRVRRGRGRISCAGRASRVAPSRTPERAARAKQRASAARRSPSRANWSRNRPARSRPSRLGDRVFHQKFGNGNVTHVDGNKLTIAFDKAGEKRVVDSFVERV